MAHPDYLLRGSDGPVTALAYFNSLGGSRRWLLSGSLQGTVLAWDLRVRHVVCRVPAHNSSVLAICVNAGSDGVLTHGRDGFVHSWRVDCSANEWTKLYSWTCAELTFCPATQFRLSGGAVVIAMPGVERSSVDIVAAGEQSITMATLVPPTDRPPGMVMGIKGVEAADGTRLIAGYEDGSLRVWCPASSAQLSCAPLHHEPLTTFDLSVATHRGVSASADGQICAWKLESNSTLRLTKELEVSARVGCVRLRADGKLVVTGGCDGVVRLYGGRQMTPLVTMQGHTEGVQCIAFDDDNSFAMGGRDRVISVWSLYRNE